MGGLSFGAVIGQTAIGATIGGGGSFGPPCYPVRLFGGHPHEGSIATSGMYDNYHQGTSEVLIGQPVGRPPVEVERVVEKVYVPVYQPARQVAVDNGPPSYSEPNTPAANAPVTPSPQARANVQAALSNYDPLKVIDALNANKNDVHATWNGSAIELKLPDQDGGGLRTSIAQASAQGRDAVAEVFGGKFKYVGGDTLVATGPLTADDIARFQAQTAAIQETAHGHWQDTSMKNSSIKSASDYLDIVNNSTDRAQLLNTAHDSRAFWTDGSNGSAQFNFRDANKHDDTANILTAANDSQNGWVVKALLDKSHLSIVGDNIVSAHPMTGEDMQNVVRAQGAWREAVSGNAAGAALLYRQTYGADGMDAPGQAVAQGQQAAQAPDAGSGSPAPHAHGHGGHGSARLSNQDKVAATQVMLQTLYEDGKLSVNANAHGQGINGNFNSDTVAALAQFEHQHGINPSTNTETISNETFKKLTQAFQNAENQHFDNAHNKNAADAIDSSTGQVRHVAADGRIDDQQLHNVLNAADNLRANFKVKVNPGLDGIAQKISFAAANTANGNMVSMTDSDLQKAPVTPKGPMNRQQQPNLG